MLYFTNSFGPDPDAARAAFKQCGKLLNAAAVKESAIVVPQKSNLDGIIQEILGESAIKILSKNNFLDLNGAMIKLFTKRNMPNSFDGPMLAIYVALEQLADLIKACPRANIIYVPWTEDEKISFMKTYAGKQIFP